jgi:hypothetical protein
MAIPAPSFCLALAASLVCGLSSACLGTRSSTESAIIGPDESGDSIARSPVEINIIDSATLPIYSGAYYLYPIRIDDMDLIAIKCHFSGREGGFNVFVHQSDHERLFKTMAGIADKSRVIIFITPEHLKEHFGEGVELQPDASSLTETVAFAELERNENVTVYRYR